LGKSQLKGSDPFIFGLFYRPEIGSIKFDRNNIIQGRLKMTIAVILKLKCQSGKGPDLTAALQSMLGDTRARQGAEMIEMVVNQDNPDHIIVYEKWATKEDHQAYMGWRQERGDLDALGGFVSEPPAVTYFDIADPG
jgi:quinol monooxygenase YgiN